MIEERKRELKGRDQNYSPKVAYFFSKQFSIGEPPLLVSAEADTGNDLVWVKCSPCNGCDLPPSPLYDQAQSSSSGELPCSSRLCKALGSRRVISDQCTDDPPLCGYRYVYGLSGDHYTQGVLGTETFTFGDGYVANNVGFGCSDTISGSHFGGTAGLVGLGRGTLSLVSQLGASRFAYCLATEPNVESTILFGSLAALHTSAGDVSSTPLVKNPRRYTLYYINLLGISFGESGGADAAARAALRWGADMSLNGGNYLTTFPKGLVCIAIMSSSDESIIGNIMQANFRLLHDLDSMTLSFQATDQC
uniref:Peptidase A1 domain-containing protein n=1 Tax=Oryza barthii TaxID=65489 RepID=A0A0D3HTS9_9ORYZ